jgi:hypothetical protein
MDPITGAVFIAGLKYVGRPSVDLVTDFLGKVLTPSATAIGEVGAHPIPREQLPHPLSLISSTGDLLAPFAHR